MDFTPLGSTYTFGDDQITSNMYLDSASMMTEAKISQRRSLPYKDEIARLQKAKDSKVQEKEPFVVIENKQTPRKISPIQPELFHNPEYSNDDKCMTIVLLIILVVMVIMIKHIYKTRRVINTLSFIIHSKKNDTTPEPPSKISPATSQVAEPAGLMNAAKK
jgi:hypothetical protein